MQDIQEQQSIELKLHLTQNSHVKIRLEQPLLLKPSKESELKTQLTVASFPCVLYLP